MTQEAKAPAPRSSHWLHGPRRRRLLLQAQQVLRDRLDIAVGQWVLAGEPIGAMGNSTIDKGGDTVGLYLELRRKGQPIDPGSWIASGKQNRTSG